MMYPMRIYTASLLVSFAHDVYTQVTCISPDAVVFESKCFELITTPSAWHDAEIYCSMFTERRSLAKVSSISESVFLNSLNPNGLKEIWIGGYYNTNEGKWRWRDGTVAKLSSLWSPNAHNNAKGDENCLEILEDGMLNDESCDSLRPFVCMEMPAKNCSSSEFQCDTEDDGDCLGVNYKCDGYKDCLDGTDERGCAGICSTTAFECANGECVPILYKCDGDDDCKDISDELYCDYDERRTFSVGDVILETQVTYCSSSDFECTDKKCLHILQKCNGYNDCDDNSDELNCAGNCSSSAFKCNNENCIPILHRCNGENDCGDKSDEKNCGSNCSSTAFECKNANCVPIQNRCNLDDDCGDNSDELNCAGICSSFEFNCNNKKCVPLLLRCNGDNDCGDNSDELSCASCTSKTARAFDTNCYEVFETEKSWYQAEELCSTFNGKRSLARISSISVLFFLQSIKPRNTNVWLGAAYNEYERKWMWNNGTKVDRTFMWHEPNNLNGRSICLEMNSKGNLNYHQCSITKFFICMEEHDPTDIYNENTTVTQDAIGNDTIKIALPIAITTSLVTFVIISYVFYSRRVSKKRILNQRSLAMDINSTNEIEENYDTLEETVNRFYKHSEEDKKQDHDINLDSIAEVNLNLTYTEPGEGQVSVPPLPRRPQQCQYIELGLVPILENESSSEDIKSFTRIWQEEDEGNAGLAEINYNSLQKLNKKSTEHLTIEGSDLKNSKVNSQQQKLNEQMVGPSLQTGIETGKLQLSDNPYDSTKTYISNAEEKEYFPFLDYHHTSTLVDYTNEDNNVYRVPFEPVILIDTPTFNHSLDTMLEQKVYVNDASSKGHNVNETKNENLYGNSDSFLTPFDQSFNYEIRDPQYDRYKSEKYNADNVSSNGKTDGDDHEYICPIDPDDHTRPISYEYHTWDGGDV